MIYFYTNGDLAWLKIAKNACSSWSQILSESGWHCEDLYNPSKPLSEFKFFGLLRDPDIRHSMGITQYLWQNNLTHLADSLQYQQLCVSAVFDEHSYGIHSMVLPEVIYSTTWFVLDHQNFNYENLVRNYLKYHGVKLPNIPILNKSSAEKQLLLQKITELKKQYPDQHAKLVKNFLGADLKLYRKVIQQQHHWDL